MFVAALFTVVKRRKQPKSPLMNEWISKMNYTHIMEHHSALKRKEILTYCTTWVNLEDIMLSEISQTQKDKLSDSTYMKYLEYSNSQRQKVEGLPWWRSG